MKPYVSEETRAKKKALFEKIAMIRVLLTSNIEPYRIVQMVIGCKETTPLHSATENKEIKKLIEEGLDVNKKNEWGETPLHHAVVDSKHAILIKWLIDYGADVNACSDFGLTPLHLAMKTGGKSDKKVIRELISHGADIDVRKHAFFSNSHGHMPCSGEKWYDQSDVVLTKFLIKITLLYGYSENYLLKIQSIYCDEMSQCFEVTQFTKNCLKEVMRLREEKLCDDFTLYDVAVSEPEELRRVPVKFLKYFPQKYPIYFDIIKSRFRNYMRRVVLFKVLQSAQMTVISEITNKEIFVNHNCLGTICEYLPNNDIGNLIKVIFDEETLKIKLESIGI